MRIGTARSDRHDAEFRFEHVAGAGDKERRAAIHHGEHRFKPAQHAIRAPIFGELDGRTRQVALVLFELRLEAFEQRECVGRCAGKPREHLVVVKPAYLFCRGFDDDVAERHLTVSAERNRPVPAHRQNGRAVKNLHQRLSFAATDAYRYVLRRLS